MFPLMVFSFFLYELTLPVMLQRSVFQIPGAKALIEPSQPISNTELASVRTRNLIHLDLSHLNFYNQTFLLLYRNSFSLHLIVAIFVTHCSPLRNQLLYI